MINVCFLFNTDSEGVDSQSTALLPRSIPDNAHQTPTDRAHLLSRETAHAHLHRNEVDGYESDISHSGHASLTSSTFNMRKRGQESDGGGEEGRRKSEDNRGDDPPAYTPHDSNANGDTRRQNNSKTKTSSSKQVRWFRLHSF